jgi:hypothetical protein
MSRYRWEPTSGASGRYRDTSTGRYVAGGVVRRELDTYIANSDNAARDLVNSLRERGINLADWELAMRREIKRTHLNAIALERGGWANMTPADYGRAGQIIREQYGYLAKFSEQIANGTQKLDGTVSSRAKLYTEAGRETFYKSKHANRAEDIDMVRSIRNATDSCEECIELDGVWFTIGDPAYKLPGDRICSKNCQCHEELGRTSPDGVESVEAI